MSNIRQRGKVRQGQMQDVPPTQIDPHGASVSPAPTKYLRGIVQFVDKYNILKLDNQPTAGPAPTASEAPPPAAVMGQPAALGVDTLHLKITEPDLPDLAAAAPGNERTVGPYLLRRLQGAFNRYQYRAEIILRGNNVKIGTLLWGSEWEKLRGVARLDIECGTLYAIWEAHALGDATAAADHRLRVVDDFIAALGCQIAGVFRVDAFVDSRGVGELLERAHRRTIRLVREKLHREATKTVGVADDAIRGLRVGSKKYGREISVYYKSKELQAGRKRCGPEYKRYVTDLHAAAGLLQPIKGPAGAGTDASDDGGIGRLEVRLHAAYTEQLEGFAWPQIFTPAGAVELLRFALTGYFEWVPTEHPDSKINRRPRVQIIDYSALLRNCNPAAAYQRRQPRPRRATDRKQRATADQRAARDYFAQTLLYAAEEPDAARADALLRTAGHQLREHHLYRWFARVGALDIRTRVAAIDLLDPARRAICEHCIDALLREACTVVNYGSPGHLAAAIAPPTPNPLDP